MFFVPDTDPEAWGAGSTGSPVVVARMNRGYRCQEGFKIDCHERGPLERARISAQACS
jgi:hypothetical protein